MSPIYWLLIIGCVFCIIHDIRAGWREREFWLPDLDEERGERL